MSCKRGICIFLLVLIAAATGTAAIFLHGRQDAWTVTAHLPGGGTVRLRTTPLLRLATSQTGRWLLDGKAWHTRSGVLHFEDQDGGLLVACDDCRLHLPRFSTEDLRLPQVYLQLRRDGDKVDGWLSNADDDESPRIDFAGTLSAEALSLRWTLASAELSDLLENVESAVPEARNAVVRGRLAAKGSIELPSGRWSVSPQLEGFEVHGLGTERLRYGAFTFTCRDSQGAAVRRTTGDGTPGWMPLRQMGALPRAVLAAEDSRFYGHPGYDMAELIPLLADAGRKEHRGASSITQQLAKNFFTGADASVSRKLRELLYAVEMERTLGKERILALYLNTVDWGPGLCGVSDASTAYFARGPARLTLAEAAWMGGILRNPHRAYRTEYLAGQPDKDRLKWVMHELRRGRKQQVLAVQFAVPR